MKSSDIAVGKNYLREDEIGALKLIVEQYLAFAEAQARAHRPMYMKDWIEALDLILTMNKKELLTNAGTISAKIAEKKAKSEYAEYKKQERIEKKLESIRELERDINALKKDQEKNP